MFALRDVCTSDVLPSDISPSDVLPADPYSLPLQVVAVIGVIWDANMNQNRNKATD